MKLKLENMKRKIGKYRGSAHWSCKIALELTKNFLVIFHNLKGYDARNW